MLSIDEQNQVKQWLQAELNGDRFPVEFDIAWVMAGYARKDHAKRRLTNQSSYLIKDEDYMINPNDDLLPQSGEWTQNGRSSDRIVMTCDAFKHFCLMAQTAKGREIRQYFIEAEKQLNATIPTCQTQALEIERLKAKIAEMEDRMDDPSYIPEKFAVHVKRTPKTEVYTLVCKLQDNQYFELMTYILPWSIAAETDLVKYSDMKHIAMRSFYEMVHLLNKMSQDLTPCLDSTAKKYAK